MSMQYTPYFINMTASFANQRSNDLRNNDQNGIDLLAILQKSLDRAIFLYIFIHEIRLSGVRASISIVHIRKFYKM